MKLTVLLDNNTLIDRYLVGEPGLSFWLEEGDAKVLFDVGYSDAFLRNAQKLGVDVCTADALALSHGHLDHTWGLDPLLRLYTEMLIEGHEETIRPKLVAHPEVFASRSIGNIPEIGSLMTHQKLAPFFDVTLSSDPVWLTEKLVFLGEIPRTNDFEAQRAIGAVTSEDSAEDDFIAEDSALAYMGEGGLVIIAGCAHAGICNIIEHARRVCLEPRVADIVGGLHLLDPPEEQLMKTVDYLTGLELAGIHPCHCTDLASKIALADVAPIGEVGSGLRLEFV